MSKTDRKRAAREEAEQKLSAQRAAEAKKKRRGWLTVIISVLAAAVVLCGVYFVSAHIEDLNAHGLQLRNETPLSTQHYKVNNAMMLYYTYQTYSSFYSQYGAYASAIGLDTSKSLKEQNSYFDADKTWFEYFTESAASEAKSVLQLCEAARSAGFKLSTEQTARIKELAGNINVENFGSRISSGDIEDAMMLTYYANAYNQQLVDTLVTNDEIDAYFTEHANDFKTFAYRTYNFTYTSDNEETKTAAKANADALAAVTTEDAFTDYVKKYYTETYTDAAESDVTAAVDATLVKDAAFKEEDELSTYAFDASRKVGDAYVTENTDESYYTVNMISALPAADETVTKNVRQIFIYSSETPAEGETSAAETRANELLEQFKAGDATEAAFAALAVKNSDYNNALYTGGLINNLEKEIIGVEAFDEWCYDGARAAGDTAVINSDSGAYVVYFVGDGLAKCKTDAYAKAYEEKYETLSETFVTVKEADSSIYDSIIM